MVYGYRGTRRVITLMLLTLFYFFYSWFITIISFVPHFSLRDFIHSVEDFIFGETKKINFASAM